MSNIFSLVVFFLVVNVLMLLRLKFISRYTIKRTIVIMIIVNVLSVGIIMLKEKVLY